MTSASNLKKCQPRPDEWTSVALMVTVLTFTPPVLFRKWSVIVPVGDATRLAILTATPEITSVPLKVNVAESWLPVVIAKLPASESSSDPA